MDRWHVYRLVALSACEGDEKSSTLGGQQTYNII